MKNAFFANMNKWEKFLVIAGFIIGFVFEYIDEFILSARRQCTETFPSFITSLDTYIILMINPSLYNPYVAYFCVVLSFIAGTAGMFYLSLILYMKGKKREGVLLFATLLLSSLLILPVKLLVQRCRPYETNTHIIATIKQAGNSFPSGHASRGFELAALFDNRGKKLRIFLYLYALIVAFSRIYLGVHYPLDVLVGSIIGWITGKVALKYQTVIVEKFSRFLRLPLDLQNE